MTTAIMIGILVAQTMFERTHSAAKFLHELGQLRAELAADADEGQFASLVASRLLAIRTVVFLRKDHLDNGTAAFHQDHLQGRVKRVVVLLDELIL